MAHQPKGHILMLLLLLPWISRGRITGSYGSSWTARRSNWSLLKEINPNSHWKDWCCSWGCNSLAIWCKEPTHWKRPWCLERLKAGIEGDDRGQDGWMASPTRWIWVWIDSGSWWWTERPGMLQSAGSPKVGHNWVTELNWTENWYCEDIGSYTSQGVKIILLNLRKCHIWLT